MKTDMSEYLKDGFVTKQAWRWQDTGILFLVLFLAAVVRFWAFARLGIDHFDEGAYAMSAMAVFEGRMDLLYPLQHMLSPPLFFSLSGLVMLMLGAPADLALFMTSGVLGTLTVGVIYIIARYSYGHVAAGVASLLIALADYHIALSRTGLTDVAFSFFFLLALVGYIKAERTESFSWAIIAGILTGLAWNTKYHGWLAGAIAGVSLLPYLLQHDWQRFRAGFSRVLLASVVATALYVPWFLYVETQEGGYLYLAEYQSTFLKPANAPLNVLKHARSQYFLDDWTGRFAPFLGLIAVSTFYRRLNGTILLLGVGLLLGGVVLGESIIVVVLAMFGLRFLLRHRPSYEQAMLISFFLVFSILSPFYRPYARLLLPFMCAAYILAGIGMVGIVRNTVPFVKPLSPGYQILSTGTLSLVLALWIFFGGVQEKGHTYLPRTGLRAAVVEMASQLDKAHDVMVVGEPAAVFYLRTLGYNASHLDKLDEMYNYYVPGRLVYLACGRYTCPKQDDWIVQYPGAILPVGRATVQNVSEIRLYDDMTPMAATQWNTSNRRDYDLQFFQLQIPLRNAQDEPEREQEF